MQKRCERLCTLCVRLVLIAAGLHRCTKNVKHFHLPGSLSTNVEEPRTNMVPGRPVKCSYIRRKENWSSLVDLPMPVANSAKVVRNWQFRKLFHVSQPQWLDNLFSVILSLVARC
jgi:hypothetical protein